MGWFWASDTAAPSAPPSAATPSAATPPPGCPMHASPGASPPPRVRTTDPPPSSCPVRHPADTAPQAQSSRSTLSKLNPLNYMPSNLSQQRSGNQKVVLPTEREISSIPRGDVESNWEYPSPQQMFNALLRKGYQDTPEDAIESMVAVHNFLNEGAWAEIVDWESRFSRGLSHGWNVCRNGEAAYPSIASKDGATPAPKLLRFQGRPKEMTPKAAMLQLLARIYPSQYNSEPPFDRHDWFVLRHDSQGKPREVRYVIDYYSAPPEPTGEPVFFLDVRPAVDGPTAAAERLLRWGGDVWYRASGAAARQGA